MLFMYHWISSKEPFLISYFSSKQGLNAALFYKNPDEKNFISLVPTSAHSGDGMGDLMAVICKLTQTRMAKKLAYSAEIQSTVMEVYTSIYIYVLDSLLAPRKALIFSSGSAAILWLTDRSLSFSSIYSLILNFKKRCCRSRVSVMTKLWL